MAKKKIESDDFIQPLGDIDKIIHEPARLMIMSYLYVVESADFIFLRNQTGLTDGNLSSHLSKLESAGYVDIEKRFKGKKPQTLLKLSREGREAFELYRKKMEQVLGGLSQK
ncbi:MAG: transcriptional regulator [Promethearchaeota archaeon]|nr:MAG: transcriptional regulator [Candidatus Lokiarchaeota archaeon]